MDTSARRIAPRPGRIFINMQGALRVISDGKRVERKAAIVDISREGVRVNFCAGLVPGQDVLIFTDVGTILGRVVWAAPAGSRLQSQAGIQFLTPNPVSPWPFGPKLSHP